MDEDFSDLVNAAERMATDCEGTSYFSFNRTIHQLAVAAEKCWDWIKSKARGQENQANALLASKGVDIDLMDQKLPNMINSMIQPLDPVGDADVKGFLRNEDGDGTVSVLQKTQKLSAESVRKTTWGHSKAMWHAEKNKVANAMLGKRSYDEMASEIEESAMFDVPSAMAYAHAVTEYKQVIMDGLVHPSLVNIFYKTAKKIQDSRAIDIWEMVKHMSDIPARHGSDNISPRASAQVQSELILQAKKYLEERYRPYMERVVSSKLRRALRGGNPDTYQIVRSFVSVRVTSSMIGLEDGVVDGEPVWPLIYYCLRCGDVKAALQVARRAESSLAEEPALESLLHAADLGLVAGVAQYLRYNRYTTDPYKRAVHCLVGAVGACDINDQHPEEVITADDLLWFDLCQIRHEDNAENMMMTYSQLQSLILEEFGDNEVRPGHYNAHERPITCFQMLILTGQFEAAVECLYRTPKLSVHGVHAAIALHEVGLLAVPSSVDTPLLLFQEGDKAPGRTLNFVRLIRLYVSSFLTSDPKVALHYFYFLRHMANDYGENMLTVCVSDLVKKSRQFDLVLGRMEADGCRSPGLIDSFKGLQTVDIIRHAARECAKCSFEDGIYLYDLANEHEQVLRIMNTVLSKEVTHVSKPGSRRARLHKRAVYIANRYRGQQTCATADTTATFHLLLDLFHFYDQYHKGQHTQALETIGRLGLVPFSKEHVTECVANFKRLSHLVKWHITDILVTVMIILQGQYQASRGSGRPSARLDRRKHQKRVFIKGRARLLTNFARAIPYRLYGDTYSQLEQTAFLMRFTNEFGGPVPLGIPEELGTSGLGGFGGPRGFSGPVGFGGPGSFGEYGMK